MLLPLKAICQQKDIRRDGTSTIYIQYCYSSEKRTQLNTEIAIPPKFWNKRKEAVSAQLPEPYGDFTFINDEIVRMIRIAEDLIALATKLFIENIGAYVKEKFEPNLDISTLSTEKSLVQPLPIKKRQPELFAQIEAYIKSKERKVTPKALATFRSMKLHLEAYQSFSNKPITFSSFDYDFYEGLVEFLSFDYQLPRLKQPTFGLKINSVGKTIKQLRIFIRDQVKRKIITPIDLSDYKIPSEDSDAIYLNTEEITRIYQANLSDMPHLESYRNLFVLACLTGLRFSDFSTLQAEDLRGNMLYKKQDKTDERVVIPMRREAKEIFEGHFNEYLPILTNPEFNRHIKTIGCIAGIYTPTTFRHKKGNQNVYTTKPKNEWITSHTARRSFCTNEFLAGTPVKLIMAISGHKSENNFYKYIKISMEEAAIKIQALWMERDDLHALPAPDRFH